MRALPSREIPRLYWRILTGSNKLILFDLCPDRSGLKEGLFCSARYLQASDLASAANVEIVSERIQLSAAFEMLRMERWG
jgi:hypothetical protein